MNVNILRIVSIGLIFCSFQTYAIEKEIAFKTLNIFVNDELFNEPRNEAEEVFEFLILRPFFGHERYETKYPGRTNYSLASQEADFDLYFASGTTRLTTIKASIILETKEDGLAVIQKLFDNNKQFKSYQDIMRTYRDGFNESYYAKSNKFNISMTLEKNYANKIVLQFNMNHTPNVEDIAQMIKFHQNKSLFSMSFSDLDAYLKAHESSFVSIQSSDNYGYHIRTVQTKGTDRLAVTYDFDSKTQLLSEIKLNLPVIHRHHLRLLLQNLYGYDGPIYESLILNHASNVKLAYYGSDYNEILDEPRISLFREAMTYQCTTKTVGENVSTKETVIIGFEGLSYDDEQEFSFRFAENNLDNLSSSDFQLDLTNPKIVYIDQDKYNGRNKTTVRKLTFDEPMGHLVSKPIGFKFEVYYSEHSENQKNQPFKNITGEILKEGECQPVTGS